MSPTSSVTVLNVERLRESCRDCSLRHLCLPDGLHREDIEAIEQIVKRQNNIKPGDHLFRQSDNFGHLYAVRQGGFKTYNLDEEGRERVVGFHLPGELLGLDAVYAEQHRCSAEALVPSSVCRIQFNQLSELAGRVPRLQRQLLRLMSREIADYETLAGDYSARERVAGFLHGLLRRMQRRGYAPADLSLSMSRTDIANYLRLATETVSRSLTQLQQDGIVKIDHREIHILEPLQLEQAAGAMAGPSTELQSSAQRLA